MQERVASIMTDHPKPDTAKIDSRNKKMRPITSDTRRPTTTKKEERRRKPVNSK
jgi:hypothetical protein